MSVLELALSWYQLFDHLPLSDWIGPKVYLFACWEVTRVHCFWWISDTLLQMSFSLEMFRKWRYFCTEELYYIQTSACFPKMLYFSSKCPSSLWLYDDRAVEYLKYMKIQANHGLPMQLPDSVFVSHWFCMYCHCVYVDEFVYYVRHYNLVIWIH